MAVLIIMAYVLIASASIFGLIVAADKYAGWASDWQGNATWILCGVFWIVAALPAAAYIAAVWWLEYREE